MAVITITPTLIPSAETFSLPLVNELGYQGVYTTPIVSTESFFTPVATIGAAAITPTNIASGEVFFSPYVARGELVAQFITSDESFYAITATPGTVSVTTTLIASSEHLSYPDISTSATDQFVSTDSLQSQEYIFPLKIGYLQTLTTAAIASSEIVSTPLFTGAVVTTGGIASTETFLPSSVQPGVATITTTALISDETVPKADLIIGSPQVSAYIPSAESFLPITITTTGSITTSVIGSQENVFLPDTVTQHNLPLRIKLPSSEYGGVITPDIAAPLLNYYTISSVLPITQDNLITTNLQRISPSYIPSTDALFSGTFYSAFYISNDTQIADSARKDIYLWINGGESFTVETSTTSLTVFQENTSILNNLISSGLSVTTQEYYDFNLNGRDRSTLFGQVKIEMLVSPSKELIEFNPDGSSIGFDLRRQTFHSSTRKMSLPEMRPGDYIGIYLKINTIFNPNDRFPLDYAFIHLSSNFYYPSQPSIPAIREVYPGQLQQVDGARLGSFLPAMTLNFVTHYDKMLNDISDKTDTLYSQYPPYFLSYKDIET